MPGGRGIGQAGQFRFILRANASELIGAFRRTTSEARKGELAFRSLRSGAIRLNRRFDRLRSSLFSFHGVVAILSGATGIGLLARGFISWADSMTLARSRLKVVVDETQDLTKIQSRLFQVSQTTRSEYDSILNTYARVARSTKALNVADSDRIKFIDVVNKAIKISGATAIEASAGLIQFSQALASNRLSGDELRSVFEQLPRLALLIAKSLGVGIGKLREFGEAGKLTADVIFNAVLDGSKEIDEEFAKVDRTVGQAFVQLKNQALFLIQDLNRSSNVTDQLAESLDQVRFIVASPEFKDGAARFLTGVSGGVKSLIVNLNVLKEILFIIGGSLIFRSVSKLAIVLTRVARTKSLASIISIFRAARLGGPTTAILGLAGSVLYYSLRAKDADVETRKLNRSIEELSKRERIAIDVILREDAIPNIEGIIEDFSKFFASFVVRESGKATDLLGGALSRFGDFVTGIIDFSRIAVNELIKDVRRSREVLTNARGPNIAQGIAASQGRIVEREAKEFNNAIDILTNLDAGRALKPIIEANQRLREATAATADLARIVVGAEFGVHQDTYESILTEYEKQRKRISDKISQIESNDDLAARLKSTTSFDARFGELITKRLTDIRARILDSREKLFEIQGQRDELGEEFTAEGRVELKEAEDRVRRLFKSQSDLANVYQRFENFKSRIGGRAVREAQLLRDRTTRSFLDKQESDINLRSRRLTSSINSLIQGIQPDLSGFQSETVFGDTIRKLDSEIARSTGQRLKELSELKIRLDGVIGSYRSAKTLETDFQRSQSLFFDTQGLEKRLETENVSLEILRRRIRLQQEGKSFDEERYTLIINSESRIAKLQDELSRSTGGQNANILNQINLEQEVLSVLLEQNDLRKRIELNAQVLNTVLESQRDTESGIFKQKTRELELRNKLYFLSGRALVVAKIRFDRERKINELIEKRNELFKQGADVSELDAEISRRDKLKDIYDEVELKRREQANSEKKRIEDLEEAERKRQRVIERSADIIARGFERAITRADSFNEALKFILGSLLRLVVQYTIIDRLQKQIEKILIKITGRRPGGQRGQTDPDKIEVDAAERVILDKVNRVLFNKDVMIDATTVYLSGGVARNPNDLLSKSSSRLEEILEGLSKISPEGPGNPGVSPFQYQSSQVISQASLSRIAPVQRPVNNFRFELNVESSDGPGVERAWERARGEFTEIADSISKGNIYDFASRPSAASDALRGNI